MPFPLVLVSVAFYAFVGFGAGFFLVCLFDNAEEVKA